ncbi:hypothetical protein BKA62DRAFT_700022, partial [Auriculariales sp. MPI-PUGE-AT-0066]
MCLSIGCILSHSSPVLVESYANCCTIGIPQPARSPTVFHNHPTCSRRIESSDGESLLLHSPVGCISCPCGSGSSVALSRSPLPPVLTPRCHALFRSSFLLSCSITFALYPTLTTTTLTAPHAARCTSPSCNPTHPPPPSENNTTQQYHITPTSHSTRCCTSFFLFFCINSLCPSAHRYLTLSVVFPPKSTSFYFTYIPRPWRPLRCSRWYCRILFSSLSSRCLPACLSDLVVFGLCFLSLSPRFSGSLSLHLCLDSTARCCQI